MFLESRPHSKVSIIYMVIKKTLYIYFSKKWIWGLIICDWALFKPYQFKIYINKYYFILDKISPAILMRKKYHFCGRA